MPDARAQPQPGPQQASQACTHNGHCGRAQTIGVSAQTQGPQRPPAQHTGQCAQQQHQGSARCQGHFAQHRFERTHGHQPQQHTGHTCKGTLRHTREQLMPNVGRAQGRNGQRGLHQEHSAQGQCRVTHVERSQGLLLATCAVFGQRVKAGERKTGAAQIVSTRAVGPQAGGSRRVALTRLRWVGGGLSHGAKGVRR